MDLSSDIDLLVIGYHNTIDLQRKIAGIQKTMERVINVMSMSPEGYKEKQKKDPFLKSLNKKKKIQIL